MADYRQHGQKLAGRAFNREWNDVGETASAAAAGNRFRSADRRSIELCCNRSHGSKFEQNVFLCSTDCRHHSEFFRRHCLVIMGYIIH